MSEDLKHFGVKGMKWGVRRHQPYQKGDGPKGKFVDAHKKADASKQARRDRTAAKRVSRGKVLDAKFSKFTDAHKKSDATKDARRSKQDARLKSVKDREKAQGKAAVSKVKSTVKGLVNKAGEVISEKRSDKAYNKALKVYEKAHDKNVLSAYNEAAEKSRGSGGIADQYNKKHYKKEFADLKEPMSDPGYQKYVEGYEKAFNKEFNNILNSKIGDIPKRKDF